MMSPVKRVVLIVVLVGIAITAGAFWMLRTCCAPAPADPRPAAHAADRADAAPVAAPSASASANAGTSGNRSAGAPAPRRAARKEAPAATPTSPAESPVPTTATLRIVSDVAGAQVFLNREFVGATPASANDLKPGSYQLNVAAPGFDNHVETIELAAGDREIVVNFREVRLDASLDVVHKHRLGSCKGRLVATPQGVRYETTDKNDAFTAALQDLDTFQVDYLNKNLRIQPRKGKRYDFTDPEGSADRLFVFHRDVEKARARLRVTAQ
jgi:hypothetical protein